MIRYILITLFIATYTLFSKPSDKIRFNANEMTELEYDFFTKIDNSQTNDIEIYYDGFLIASGIVDYNEFNIYKEKLNNIRQKARDELTIYKSQGAYEFGRILLNWLYDSGILKKYFETSTLFQDLIYKGEYNCLTSSILYSLLYSEFGFKATGILTSNHAFSVSYTERGNIDVETTVKGGFNPGTKEIRNTGNSTIVTFVPKQNYNNRIEVDILTLIATLYPNSITLKNVEKDLLKQLTMAKKAYYLSPNTELYTDNLINAYNKVALDYIKKMQYKDAYNYLKKAYTFDPDSKLTRNNQIHYFNTVGVKYLQNKDFSSAIQIYKIGIKEIENADVLKKNLKVSYYNYAVTEYNSGRYNNALTISEEALLIFPNDEDFIRFINSIPK